ncbi:hypothetical protein I4000191A8_17210 [Clostridia bacterium i40-0019-1A8]
MKPFVARLTPFGMRSAASLAVNTFTDMSNPPIYIHDTELLILYHTDWKFQGTIPAMANKEDGAFPSKQRNAAFFAKIQPFKKKGYVPGKFLNQWR